MPVTNQDIINLYTQSMGRAPDPSVVDYYVNDINNNGTSLQDLANTLGAFRANPANASFFQGANYGNSVQSVIDAGNAAAGMQPGTVVNRGTFGDPMRSATVGSGDHAGQLGYTRYDGSTYWTGDPSINHTDEHVIFDANGNGVAYGYNDPNNPGKMIATSGYRTGTPDSPFIISNNYTQPGSNGSTNYYNPGGTMYGNVDQNGYTTYTPESGLSGLNMTPLWNSKTNLNSVNPNSLAAYALGITGGSQQTPPPQSQPQNTPPQWGQPPQGTPNISQNTGGLGGLGGWNPNQNTNSPVYHPQPTNGWQGWGNSNPFRPSF